MIENKSERITNGTISKPKTLYGYIYFKTNQAILSTDDIHVLDELIGFCGLLLIYSKVALYFEGRADVRGTTRLNKKLSEDRATEVQRYVDNRLKSSCNYISFVTGLGATRTSKDFADDRRVDIFITQIKKSIIKPRELVFTYPKPFIIESNYLYQQVCDNMDMIRPYILKYYHPDYEEYWKPLENLIKKFNLKLTINSEEYIWVDVRKEHIRHILKMVDHYFDEWDINATLRELKHEVPEKVYGDCFRIIFYREYPKAKERAEDDWLSSDYRYYCEWWARKINRVPADAPYTRSR